MNLAELRQGFLEATEQTLSPKDYDRVAAYVTALESAWQQDGNLGAREYNSQRQLTQVRQLFERATLRRGALVQLLLDEPNIVRMLDVSTAHLPQQDRSDLVVGDVPGQTVATVYGGLVNTATWTLPENDGEPPEGASEPLNAIMQHALARRCQYVMFDADAPELPGFPTFED